MKTSNKPKPRAPKYIRCIRCGRLLKDDESKERGFGPICWEKISNQKQIPLF